MTLQRITKFSLRLSVTNTKESKPTWRKCIFFYWVSAKVLLKVFLFDLERGWWDAHGYWPCRGNLPRHRHRLGSHSYGMGLHCCRNSVCGGLVKDRERRINPYLAKFTLRTKITVIQTNLYWLTLS